MGCIGAALMAIDSTRKQVNKKTEYSLNKLLQSTMKIDGSFCCKSCSNNCEIKKIKIDDKIYPFGGLCSKFDNQRHNTENRKQGINLIQHRNDLMLNKYGPELNDAAKGNIGIPMALSAYELYPFYCRLINELGYNVVAAEPSREGNAKNLAPICYPGELVHGAVFELLKLDVDYILLPNLLSHFKNSGFVNSYMCPSTSIMPDVIKSAFRKNESKILSPHISFLDTKNKADQLEIIRIGNKLKVAKNKAISAYCNAVNFYNSFKREYKGYCSKVLSSINNDPVIIFAGRPYTVFADNVNLSIPQKITSRGYNVIPVDAVPFNNRNSHIENNWYYTQQLMNAVHYVKNNPNFYLCFLSCFSCGPDANIYHEIKKEMAGKVFCYLEIDSHTAHAGIETRLEAFLEIIKGDNEQL